MNIYTHKHHIIPRHAGGTDDPSNLVELTIEDHAIAHEVRYRMYGDDRDRVAALMLRGQISKYDAFIEMVSRPKSKSWRKARSEKYRGEGNPFYGKKQSNKQKEAVRKANSVSKPHVSDNMKKLHAEGKARQWTPEEARAMVAKRRPRKWYTNGTDNKAVCEGDPIPEGYSRGRTTGWKTHLKQQDSEFRS